MNIDKAELARAILGGIGVTIGLWAWCILIITAVGQ
jgi:hypothetical protein